MEHGEKSAKTKRPNTSPFEGVRDEFLYRRDGLRYGLLPVLVRSPSLGSTVGGGGNGEWGGGFISMPSRHVESGNQDTEEERGYWSCASR